MLSSMLMSLLLMMSDFDKSYYGTSRKLHEFVTVELQKEEVHEVEEIREIIEPLTVYRQTYYSVEEGETKVGAGFRYTDSNIKIIDNVIHYRDKDYGYLPVIAVNIDEVKQSGLDNRGTWSIYGSVVELGYGVRNQKAIILDACGACKYSNKIDLWVYKNNVKHDVPAVSMKYIRRGWNNYLH